MSNVPFLEGAAIRDALPIAAVIDAVEAAYRDVAGGRDLSPLRSHVELDDGTLLLMPGVRAGGSGATVKLVTIMPGNASRGRPTLHAVVVWFDAGTGEPVAMMDGATVTAMRTGAASGVATRLLSRPDASTLAVIGAGGQAEWQVRAVVAVRPIRRVLVYARSREQRVSFAAEMADATGLEVVSADTARGAVEAADVVCCATTSSSPVFDAAWLRPGTHVNGIGAFQLSMVELPTELFGRADLVAVDSVAAALAEAGDVAAALRAGAVAEADLVEIGAVDPSWCHGRDQDAITVFKSVGLAIQDVATAELVADRLIGVRER